MESARKRDHSKWRSDAFAKIKWQSIGTNGFRHATTNLTCDWTREIGETREGWHRGRQI